MRILVLHKWVATEADTFEGGEHDVEASGELAKALALALHQGGVIEVVEASAKEQKALEGHIESDEESLAAQEAAQASGAWQYGNVLGQVYEQENRAANEELPDDARAAAAAAGEQARALLASLDEGLSYDEAVDAWHEAQQAAGTQPAPEAAPEGEAESESEGVSGG